MAGIEPHFDVPERDELPMPPGYVRIADLDALRAELMAQIQALEDRMRTVEKNGGSKEGNAEGGEEKKGGDEEEAGDDDNDSREYGMQESVWDCVLLAGLGTAEKGMKMGDLVWLLFIIILTGAIQIIFCLIVFENMVSSPITDAGLKELALWRMVVGHKVEYYDDLTHSSLVGRICEDSLFGIMASSQQVMGQDLGGYTWGSGIEAIVSAPCLCLIALMFWFLQIAGDLLGTFDFGRAVLSCKKSFSSMLAPGDEEGKTKIASLSWFRVIIVLVTVFLPKLGIAGFLGFSGAAWLIHTHDPGDLILNAVALVFVLDADEMMYNHLVPHRVRDMVSEFQPVPISKNLRCSYLCRRCMPFRAMFTFVMVGMALGISVPYLLHETWVTHEGYRLLCDGNTDFVYSVDVSSGYVATADVTPWNDVDVDEAMSTSTFRAVLQKTELELIDTLEDEEEFEEGGTYYHELTALDVSAMNLFNFKESVDKFSCEDQVELNDGGPVDKLKVYMQQPFMQKYPGNESCEDMTTEACLTYDGRAYCPVTCGCQDFANGMFDRGGCPNDCYSDIALMFVSEQQFLVKSDQCADFTDKVDEYKRYFSELQAYLVSQQMLTLYPMLNNTYFPSDQLFVNFVMYVFFELYFPSPYNGTNFSLADWAEASYNYGVAQMALPAGQRDSNQVGSGGIPIATPCRLISFVHRFFGFDACNADDGSGGNLGFLRGICPYTCGYCTTSDQIDDYENWLYPKLWNKWMKEWMVDGSFELQSLSSDTEKCDKFLHGEEYEQFASTFEEFMYFC
jgi:hypothetical protein